MLKKILQKMRWVKWKLQYGKRLEAPWKGIFLGSIKMNISKTGKLALGKGFSCRDDIVFNISEGIISIASNTFINDGCKLNARKNISIGSGCVIGQNVLMYDHDHNYHRLETLHNDFITGGIIIGNNVWIGSNVVILRGASIGDGCVIGAGCIIKEKIVPGTLVYPEQHKVVRKIREERRA